MTIHHRPPATLPDFAPVPRKHTRHDGWTPERQRAFVEALADAGTVHRAAAMVNMSPESAYQLRRAAGAEGFRRAWEAALDCGVLRMKDIAFERAVEGELVPVVAGGKIIGYRRRFNDRLLMFCLRHYGQDAAGRRTTINYFSTRATAGAAAAPAGDGSVAPAQPGAQALAATESTTIRTVVTGPAGPEGEGAAADRHARADATAATLAAFEGVPLDAEAEAAIRAALEACAARRRDQPATADPAEPWIPAEIAGHLECHPGALQPEPLAPNEVSWTILDDHAQLDAIEAAVEGMKRGKGGERTS